MVQCRVKHQEESAWEHTSAVMATLANCHRDQKRKPTPYRPADFNPLRKSRGQSNAVPITAENIGLLKEVFCSG